jgi:LEA14-like dessication related protein
MEIHMRRAATQLSVTLLLLALAACAAVPPRVEPLWVTLADLRPAKIGLLEQEYALKIRVQNPNEVEIPMSGLSYQVDLNGKPFAKGVSRQSTTVPAFGEVLLDVSAVSGLSGILEQLSAMREAVPQRITYRLQGRLASPSRGSVPFDQTGSLDLSGFAEGDQR